MRVTPAIAWILEAEPVGQPLGMYLRVVLDVQKPKRLNNSARSLSQIPLLDGRRHEGADARSKLGIETQLCRRPMVPSVGAGAGEPAGSRDVISRQDFVIP